MAIVTDPDDLNRFAVAVNPGIERISIRGLGTARVAKQTDGAVTFGSGDTWDAFTEFTGTADFASVVAGDILTIVKGNNIGHYIVSSAPTTSRIIIDSAISTFNGFDNLVTNGNFASGANWTVDTNWAIGSGTLNSTAATTAQRAYQTLTDNPLANSTVYETTFEITAYTGGTVNIDLGGAGGAGGGTDGAGRTGTGVFTERLTSPGSTGQQVTFENSVASTLSIDHVHVSELVTYRVDQATGEAAGPSGGTVGDGVTLQAVYSFLKEEWRTFDTSLFGTTGADEAPDLIKFTFPIESITREQFEIGGPTHSNWDFADNTTRNLIRTGGWSSINVNNVIVDVYPGVITLGSLDSDTVVYFIQANNFTTTPTDFVLTGAVNQSVNALTVTGGFATTNVSTTNKVPTGQVTGNIVFTATDTIDGGASVNFVTLGYAVGDKVQIVAAEDAGNIGIFTIVTIVDNAGTNDRMTVSGVSITSNTDDDTALLSPVTDNRDFLKLFARKKARTYVDADLTDIGVTQLESIVNRFPLSHVTDPAITLDDGQLAGDPSNSVFASVEVVDSSGTNGDMTASVPADGTFAFTAAAQNFNTDLNVGDTVSVETEGTGGSTADIGFYEILSVDGATSLTCFNEPLVGSVTDPSSADVTFSTYTRYRKQQATDGVLSDPTGADNEGRLTSAGGTFTTDGGIGDRIVVAGDMVVMTDGFLIGPFTGANGLIFSGATIEEIGNNDFTADGLIVGDRITIASAEDAANNGTYDIIAIATTSFDILTVRNTDGTAVSFTGNTDDETATIRSDNWEGVYKVATGGVAATTLDVELNDPDDHFPTSGTATSITFHVLRPTMILQYRSKFAAPRGPTLSLAYSGATIRRTADIPFAWSEDNYVVGGTVVTASSEDGGVNNGTFIITALSNGGQPDDTVTLINTDGTTPSFTANTDDDSVTITGNSGHVRAMNGVNYSFNWRLFGNSGTLAQCFQWIQRQLRRGRASETLAQSDIDTSQLQFRGDISDLLMTFSSPTGTTINMFIDDLAAADFNNVTKSDITGTGRNFAFIAGITINLNTNITDGATNKIVVFFTDPDGNATTPVGGNEFGTVGAIIVQDDTPANMEASDQATTPLTFNFDYDNNVQGGRDSTESATPITIVAITTDTGQYVQTTGNILRQSSNIFSLVAALERNYQNN